jgi:DNA-binding NarL/FixJ family response regulator
MSKTWGSVKMVERIRILIVDDQAIVRKSLRMFLNTDPFLQVIGEARDVQDASSNIFCG